MSEYNIEGDITSEEAVKLGESSKEYKIKCQIQDINGRIRGGATRIKVSEQDCQTSYTQVREIYLEFIPFSEVITHFESRGFTLSCIPKEDRTKIGPIEYKYKISW